MIFALLFHKVSMSAAFDGEKDSKKKIVRECCHWCFTKNIIIKFFIRIIPKYSYMRPPGDILTPDDSNENENYTQAVYLLKSKALTDEDPLARKHALYLLGITGDFQFADIFINSLHDPEKAVRSQAVQALVQIGLPVISPIVRLLNDKDWRVRYRAAEILGMIKGEEAVIPLIMALSDEKDHVRYMAAKSLCLIREPKAIEPLMICLCDENHYVRRMAERAISTIEKKNS